MSDLTDFCDHARKMAALFARLADEIDAYLTDDDDHPTIEGT